MSNQDKVERVHLRLTGSEHTPIWPVRLEQSIEPIHRLVHEDGPSLLLLYILRQAFAPPQAIERS